MLSVFTLQVKISPSHSSKFRDQSSFQNEGFLPHPVNIISVPEDDAAIFYIDPPDKPIRQPEEKHPLVSEHLRQGLQDDSSPEQAHDQVDQDRNSEQPKTDHTMKQVKKIGGFLSNQNQIVSAQRDDVKHAKVLERRLDKDDTNKQAEIDRLRDELFNMKAEKDSLIEEWQKLREEKHKLLEDKIRLI